MAENEFEVGVYVESDHMMADDRLTSISGSQRLDRDLYRDRRVLDPLGTLEYWREKRKGRAKGIPLGKHWCSHPDHEMRDEDGEDDEGWRPVEEFTEYRGSNGKMRRHDFCNGCRAKHQRKMYALQREAEGKTVQVGGRGRPRVYVA